MPLTAQERVFHNSFPPGCVAVWQGDLVEITYTGRNREKHPYGKRGVVGGFTRAARLRMIRTLARVQWEKPKFMLFVTLTYPDSHVDRGSRERSVDRARWFRDMEKYLGRKVGALWRVEWKPRKSGRKIGVIACHVHLVLFGVEFLPFEKVNGWWKSALGVSGYLRTDVRRIRGAKAAAKYVSKYAAKAVDPSSLVNSTYHNSLGRHWGLLRREEIPWAERFVIPCLDDGDVRLAEGFACSVFAYFTRGTQQGFSLFGENGAKLGEILFSRMIDKENAIA